ncbi:MAG: hypothetical protein ACPG4Y_09135 [Chitinophagales bacterium]
MKNLASQYFIKAKENYQYAIDEALEALNYALSYDNEHAGAHCLMARYYSDYELNYDEAVYHFQQSLKYDVNYNETYYFYIDLLLKISEFKKAKNLINFAKNVKGVCMSCIIQREALLSEKLNNLKKAKQLLKLAIAISTINGEIHFLNSELVRVKNKVKAIKKLSKKDKTKESKEMKIVYKYK